MHLETDMTHAPQRIGSEHDGLLLQLVHPLPRYLVDTQGQRKTACLVVGFWARSRRPLDGNGPLHRGRFRLWMGLVGERNG